MPDPSAPESNSEFVEKLRPLSPAERARAMGDEAKRNLGQIAAEHREASERAKLFGQWVMIGSYGAFMMAAWIAYWYMEPALGSELAIGVLAVVSVFVAVGGIRLGKRVEMVVCRQAQARGRVMQTTLQPQQRS